MPESPEELFARAADDLRLPPVERWQSWPFEGEVRLRALSPPTEADRPRHGAGGVDCHACAAPDGDYLWTNERWRVRPLDAPSGLPLVVLVEPREHVAELGDMPDELAAEMGVVLSRCERAARTVGEIGRVHVCRWNDGGEHLHWWVMARPARLPQVVGTFAALWDDVLPPLPEELWRANLAVFVDALSRDP